MVNSGTGESGECGIQHAIEHRTDQKRRQSLRRSHQRHQEHREHQRREVGPDVVEEAPEFPHARLLGRRRTVSMALHHFRYFDRVDPVRARQHRVLGAPRTPVVDVGRSEQHHHRAARTPPRCEPVRCRFRRRARRPRAAILLPPAARLASMYTSQNADKSSFAPATNTGSSPEICSSRCFATARNFPRGQVLSVGRRERMQHGVGTRPRCRRWQTIARAGSRPGARPDRTWPTPDVRRCEPSDRRPKSPARAECGRCTSAGSENGRIRRAGPTPPPASDARWWRRRAD